MLEIVSLGTGLVAPTNGRNLSGAIVIRQTTPARGESFLFDCGGGHADTVSPSGVAAREVVVYLDYVSAQHQYCAA